jgi:hypothetical protein
VGKIFFCIFRLNLFVVFAHPTLTGTLFKRKSLITNRKHNSYLLLARKVLTTVQQATINRTATSEVNKINGYK